MCSEWKEASQHERDTTIRVLVLLTPEPPKGRSHFCVCSGDITGLLGRLLSSPAEQGNDSKDGPVLVKTKMVQSYPPRPCARFQPLGSPPCHTAAIPDTNGSWAAYGVTHLLRAPVGSGVRRLGSAGPVHFISNSLLSLIHEFQTVF